MPSSEFQSLRGIELHSKHLIKHSVLLVLLSFLGTTLKLAHCPLEWDIDA